MNFSKKLKKSFLHQNSFAIYGLGVTGRSVINFFDWPVDKAKNYEECFKIIEDKVRPHREEIDNDSKNNYWWQFWRRRKELFEKI